MRAPSSPPNLWQTIQILPAFRAPVVLLHRPRFAVFQALVDDALDLLVVFP